MRPWLVMCRHCAFWLFFLLSLTGFSLAQDPGSTGVSITTWQNDTHRTGRNLNEGVLVAPLTGISFGQLCNVQLDGQVYAQPLVETNVHINGTLYPKGVAYVVTHNDTLYAINGTPTTGSSTSSPPVLDIFSGPNPWEVPKNEM